MIRLIRLFLSLVLLCCAPQLHAQLLHISNANEPSIAIDPDDPDRIVVATNVDRFYLSKDAGAQWTEVEPTSAYGIYGDPVLHYVGSQLYFAHLSKTKGKVWGDWFDRIVVQRIDDVETWQEQSFSVGFNDGKMQDKPWLSGDTFSSSPYKGQVNVSWTEFDKYGSSDPSHFSRIRFARLTPGDTTFSQAITVSDTVGDCEDGDHTLEGAVTAVGPEGQLYMVWAGHGNIYFDKSMDGGRSWGKDRIITQQQGSWAIDIPHLMRANGMPFMQIAPNGHIMVMFSEVIRDKALIRVYYSKDEGSSWTQAPIVAGRGSQYLPNLIATSEGFKSLHIDHSRSSSGFFFDVILSEFRWEGDRYQMYTHPINPNPIPLPGQRVFFGDYVDLDQVGKYTLAVYTSYDGTEPAVEVRSANDASAKSDEILQLHWVVDRDSLHLVYRSSTGFRLKGELNVRQGGTRTNVKIRSRIRRKDKPVQEGIITSVPIKGGEPVELEWKATYRKRILCKAIMIEHASFYP